MGPRLKREAVLNNTPTVTNTPRAGESAEQSKARTSALAEYMNTQQAAKEPSHHWKIDKSATEVMAITHIAVFENIAGEWVERSHHKTLAEARAWIEMQRLPEYHK
jgi:hypothetical protein